MPYYMVKITVRDTGLIRQPILAHADSDNDARDLVKYLCDAGDRIEAKEIRDDVAIAAYGAIPKNRAMICRSWSWMSDEGFLINAEPN